MQMRHRKYNNRIVMRGVSHGVNSFMSQYNRGKRLGYIGNNSNTNQPTKESIILALLVPPSILFIVWLLSLI